MTPTERIAKIEQLTTQQAHICSQMSHILEHLPVAVIVCDSHGNFLVWNEEATRLCGKPGYESTPDEWSFLYEVYEDEQDAKAKRLMEWEQLPLVRAMRGEGSDYKTIYINGQYVMTHSAKIDDDLFALCMWEVGKCGEACLMKQPTDQ